MKIAIFHNFLDNIGGAERVGLILAKELNADIYTTNIDAEKIKKMGFGDLLPRIFSIGRVPYNAPFRQQSALSKFRHLNLKKKYDFYIIDGDWAVSGAVNNKPNLWYVHSPIREIWDLYPYTRKNTVPLLLRPIFDLWVLYNRHLNKRYVNQVGIIACNSNTTKERVKNFLNKDAEVIYPPTETSKYRFFQVRAFDQEGVVSHKEGQFDWTKKFENYWLSVNRLITHKRIDLQLKAFAKLTDEKLVVVGSYEQSRHFKKYAEYCRSLKTENVKIESWVDEEQLIYLYSKCKGFITTSQDEDFGMNVVEAMASGKPVIAPNEGGYKETIIDGETGVLIDDINPQKIIDAMKRIESEMDINPEKYHIACQTQAKKFDVGVFVQKIKALIGYND